MGTCMKKYVIFILLFAMVVIIAISGCTDKSQSESVTTCTIEEVPTPPNYTYKTFVGDDGQLYTQKYETYDMSKHLVRNVCITIGDSNYDLFIKSIIGKQS